MRIITLLLIVFLSACLEKTVTPVEPVADTQGERLQADAPLGWRLTYSTDTANMSMSTYIPETDDQNNWQEKITFERLSGTPLDPIDLLTGLAADQKSTCDTFDHQNTFSGLENGYPTSVRIFVCNNNPLIEQGQVTLIKAIQGEEYTYIVTRAKRMPPFEGSTLPLSEEEMGGWSLYLRAITVCNTDSAEHACLAQKREEGNAVTTDASA